MRRVIQDLEPVNVTKRYRATVAVDAVSHHFRRSSDTCLLGPSGCDKSSTLRFFAGHESISSVADSVAFRLKMKGVVLKDRRAKAGDMQELVDLAAQTITRPQVLLLDEPLSALGPLLRVRMCTEWRKLQKELCISFVHVTHGQDEALALAADIVVMTNAVIEQAGPAQARWTPNLPRSHTRTTMSAS